MSDLEKLPFIQILVRLTTIRVYYIPSFKMFFFSVIELSEVTPLGIKDLKSAINQLESLIKNECSIDFTIFYPNNIPNGIKREIKQLCGEFKQKDYNSIIKKSLLILLKLRKV